MINSKKGISLTPNEIIELILVIAGMFLLIVAFLYMTNPGFDVNKETAKSYLATLQKEIQKADDGKIGEFMIWQETSQAFFCMIYFGDKRRQMFETVQNKQVYAFANYDLGKKNLLCICYYTDKFKCEDCVNLDSGAIFQVDEKNQFIVPWWRCYLWPAFIKKIDGIYYFAGWPNLLNNIAVRKSSEIKAVEQTPEVIDVRDVFYVNFINKNKDNEMVYFSFRSGWEWCMGTSIECAFSVNSYWKGVSEHENNEKKISDFENSQKFIDLFMKLEDSDMNSGKQILTDNGGVSIGRTGESTLQ